MSGPDRQLRLKDLIDDRDLTFEEDLLRDAQSLRRWLRYIAHKLSLFAHDQQVGPVVFVYERACRALPGSYKLWKAYLSFRVDLVKGMHPIRSADEFEKVNRCFERALPLLNKMPRLWTDYLDFLMQQPLLTRTRRTFNRALQALPLSQHDQIWKRFRPWYLSAGGRTSQVVMQRHMQIDKSLIEELIAHLIEQGDVNAAAKHYLRILSNPRFRSAEGKSQFQLWSDFCDLLVQNARRIRDVDVEVVIRGGIHKFTDQTGRLWTSLATYWITLGDFERARNIFEEGIGSVDTVRDFAQLFDAYADSEEFQISKLMEKTAAEAEEGKPADPENDTILDMLMLRFEQLMDRRPFLLNDVLLRQNPHNVHEWEKRVELWGEDKNQIVATYTRAIQTINPKRATGKYPSLWRNFARFYEAHGDLVSARKIMEKATRVVYKSVGDLAEVYCEWAEMELQHEAFDRAMQIMKVATQAPQHSSVDYRDETLTPQERLHKSSKVWMFYVDLVESVGTLEETRHIYDRMLELRIATPQTIVNYANMLEENGYFEDSFRIYERGVDLFSYPVAFELWNLYLTRFLKRFKGSQMERARDLFEQALRSCPPKFAKPIYLLYAIDLEEQYGLLRNCMRILDRATQQVDPSDKAEVFRLYIAKMAQSHGLTATRPLYERAIQELDDAGARAFSAHFAKIEAKLGEIDRARAIWAHGSQFADPQLVQDYWQAWHDFEVKHGNEDTYAVMLQVKRSVQAGFSTDAHYIAKQIAQAQNGDSSSAVVEEEVDQGEDPMAALERHAPSRAPAGFVSGGVQGAKLKETQDAERARLDEPVSNPDQIELEDDEDET
ncbi:pre-mRNA-splicing factor syf1 [Protomyces lactucae-debilis]|uniref:Pre-mRNA-splicing factor SYF1 n=1 Tax=Protomyces lactucae-debilis TaxID=2754530 RepID=A0A1Y2FBQ3_PROLT|nr:pre-mRNA-splicing factor syf1 [Protomyces lactucae-debilis]ORY81349.1 pre-mRNA-splicing factor syf1 [Protomyces lactucae-debilis]